MWATSGNFLDKFTDIFFLSQESSTNLQSGAVNICWSSMAFASSAIENVPTSNIGNVRGTTKRNAPRLWLLTKATSAMRHSTNISTWISFNHTRTKKMKLSNKLKRIFFDSKRTNRLLTLTLSKIVSNFKNFNKYFCFHRSGTHAWGILCGQRRARSKHWTFHTVQHVVEGKTGNFRWEIWNSQRVMSELMSEIVLEVERLFNFTDKLFFPQLITFDSLWWMKTIDESCGDAVWCQRKSENVRHELSWSEATHRVLWWVSVDTNTWNW